MTWIQENGPSAWTNAGTTQADSIFGTPFILTVDSHVYAVRYFRSSATAGSGHRPSELAIWSDASHTKLWSTSSIPDNGAVAWQTFTIDPPLALAPGNYVVTGYWPSNSGFPQITASSVTPPSPPLQYGVLLRRYHSTNGNVWPETGDSAQVMGIDCYVVPDSGFGSAGATPDDVANELAAWLSVDDGTHTDSAPLQDHATLATVAATTATIDTTTAAIEDQQNEWAFGLGSLAHGYYGLIKSLIDTIKGETDALPDFIEAVTNVMLDHYSADIDSILAQIDSVLGIQTGTAGGASGSISGRSPFPGTGWFLAAETDFEDAIAFDSEADAYVLHITSVQPTQPINSGPAGNWMPRLGWWCVLTGSLASSRAFVEFEFQLLTDQGRRMPGCAIQLKPGTLAHVQAWQLA